MVFLTKSFSVRGNPALATLVQQVNLFSRIDFNFCTGMPKWSHYGRGMKVSKCSDLQVLIYFSFLQSRLKFFQKKISDKIMIFNFSLMLRGGGNIPFCPFCPAPRMFCSKKCLSMGQKWDKTGHFFLDILNRGKSRFQAR